MSETKNCPKCGVSLPADAPAGLCPQCLLNQGLEADDSRRGDSTADYNGGFVAPDPADLAPHFPQLEMLELIGKGGMGAVYKARQKQLDRLVALKILPPEVGRDPAFAERFSREAKALARLNHHNIIDVYDFGSTGGLYYLTMEYVDGTNLRELIRAGVLAPQQALAIVPQICEALQFAHNEEIVHRDIKPENILVNRRGQVKIADFGLAKLLGKSSPGATLTGTRQVMGTPHYMAPEQMQGSHEVDHRADIYSLGVVFYEMLTGQLPIGRFEPPSRRVEVDVRLDEVVLRTLESDPQRRYQHASDVQTDVQSIRDLSPVAHEQTDAGKAGEDNSDAIREEIRRPAMGLLITGIADWIALPITLAVLLLTGDETIPTDALLLIGLGGLALSGTILFGAIKMMRLESYGAAVVASVLAMVVTPGNLVGLPIGIWAFVTLISRDVRTAFSMQAGRRLRNETRAAVADSDTERKSSRPRMVPIFATLNVVVALMLMFILAAPDPEPLTDGENPWRVYEQVTAVLGFFMATGLFAAAIGLYLWRPWGRKLTIGVMIYGLVSLVIDIPYMARYAIPELYTEIQLDWMADGTPPAAAEVSAMHLLALIFIPVIVTGLIWNVGQMVYMMRPRVIAAFEMRVDQTPSR